MIKKNIFGLLAVLSVFVMAGALALGLAGCDLGGGPDGDTMDGTWKDNSSGQSFIFSGVDITMQLNGVNYLKGFFNFTNERTQLSFYITQKWEDNTWVAYSETQTFSFQRIGNSFTLTFHPPNAAAYVFGTYTKL